MMKRHRCLICANIYDPAQGDPEHGIAPGTPFEALPAEWVCPVCGEEKWGFEALEDPATPVSPQEPHDPDEPNER